MKQEKVFVYSDGGARGNPGPGAIGVLVLDEKENKLEEFSECAGITTNNQAEYKALIKGLELASKHCSEEVQCFSDSELIVSQVSGKYKIKKKELRKLFFILKEKEKAFKKASYFHVQRSNKFIKMADRLLNQKLNLEGH